MQGNEKPVRVDVEDGIDSSANVDIDEELADPESRFPIEQFYDEE